MHRQNLHKAFTAIFVLVTIAFASCSNQPDGPCFTVKGNIKDADGKILTIKNIGVNNTIVLDSMELDEEGTYEFTIPSPGCFEFYSLVLGDESILLTVDSTETVTVNSNAKEFATAYSVEGSTESEKIKEINTLRDALAEQISAMLNSTSPAVMKTRNDILLLINEFKDNLVKQYIASNPGSASSYYILSLSLDGTPLFMPMTERTDSKYLAAVATNIQLKYPDSERTRQLVDFAQKAMKATSPVQDIDIEVEEEEIATTGLFDINLPTMNGDSIKLSSFAGKVVLLDFTIYKDPNISGRNIGLRELYAKYKEQGFEIYQISFDTDKHFWQTSASNLPWTCVRDGNGAASSYALLYNVRQLPTFYLINKDNEIVLRDNQITDLGKEIERLITQ